MPRITGRNETSIAGGEQVNAFVPHRLPPTDPRVDLGCLDGPLHKATLSLTRLEAAGEMVPSLDWFIYAFVRKEAVLSSQIEGTQATLEDLLNHEAAEPPDNPTADVEEICNYIDALTYARAQLADPKAPPLCMRMLNATHARLMKGVRGATKLPGEVRRSQNWIGGSRPGNAVFVPPPPHLLAEEISALERYIHQDDPTHPIIRTGMIHVQFESLHPYLDGNGRVGRLLISLLFEHWGLLTRPLLYLSLFFKRHRAEYYRRLSLVRTDGDWEGWLTFFLEAVTTIAEEAVATIRDLFSLVSSDRKRLLDAQQTVITTVRLFELLPTHPIVSATSVTRLLNTSRPTATRALDALVDARILTETTGKRRDRTFAYQNYLNCLRKGTEVGDR